MHHYTYILAYGRTLYTHTYARTLMRTPSFAYTRTFANMCAHTHRKFEHKRTSRLSRYLAASLHYRTRGSSRNEQASERRWWRRLKISLWRHYTGPSAKNQCEHPAKNLVFFFLRCWPPRLSYSLLLLEDIPDHVNIECMMWKRAWKIARFTYRRISILILWIQFTSWIVQVETTDETTKHRARYRSCWRRGRSLSIRKKDMDERARVTRCDFALTLIKTHTSYLSTIQNRLSHDLQILSMR